MDKVFQMLDNAADGAFAVDDDQSIVYWNKTATKILGYHPEEAIGRACYKILRGCDDEGCVLCHPHCDVSIEALNNRSVDNYDIVTRTKSGQARWLNISILTTFSTDGSKPLVIHLFRDASQTKQNELLIQQMFETVDHWPQVGPPAPQVNQLHLNNLTNREEEVLSLLVNGHNTKSIATALSISPTTVRNHIQNILHKLNVHSRVEAVAYAIEHGHGPNRERPRK